MYLLAHMFYIPQDIIIFCIIIKTIFRAVLGSQQNREEGTEISHRLLALTHAQPPP